MEVADPDPPLTDSETSSIPLSDELTEDVEEGSDDAVKRDQIESLANKDPLAADMLLSIFIASLRSYRVDSVLRPFPKHFTKEPHNDKDFPSLREAAKGFPSIRQIAKENKTGLCSAETLYALHWALFPKNFSMTSVSPALFDTILSAAGSTGQTLKPDCICEVQYRGPESENFDTLVEEHGSVIAFHGTALENFHSISRIGFCNHLNQTKLYGHGTYLSTDLPVANDFSKPGRGWEKSKIGKTLTCVAVCQVAKHPDVKFPGHTAVDSDVSGNVKVPEKYIVVPNNEHVRLKYILIYRTSAAETAITHTTRNGISGWISRNKFLTVMLVYGLILIFIGLSKNRAFRRWLAQVLP